MLFIKSRKVPDKTAVKLAEQVFRSCVCKVPRDGAWTVIKEQIQILVEVLCGQHFPTAWYVSPSK